MIPNCWLPYDCSRITMELREVLETKTEEGTDFHLFDFEYPSYYTGQDKLDFEQKVIDHYFFRQIGFETIPRFKHMFKAKMREIMPYYIQMYKSAALMGDPEDPDNPIKPLENYHLYEVYSGENSGDTQDNTTLENNLKTSNTGTDQVVSEHLDTPQSKIGNMLNVTQDHDTGYLTDAQRNKTIHGHIISDTGNSETESTGHTEGTDSHTLERYGNIGVMTYSDLLKGYRETFLNIDMMIIDELNSLFLQVH